MEKDLEPEEELYSSRDKEYQSCGRPAADAEILR
jgi:hypothetical protein